MTALISNWQPSSSYTFSVDDEDALLDIGVTHGFQHRLHPLHHVGLAPVTAAGQETSPDKLDSLILGEKGGVA
jgi:hypothetical protein